MIIPVASQKFKEVMPMDKHIKYTLGAKPPRVKILGYNRRDTR